MALGVLVAILFLTFLDNTIVSVALGSVQSDLHAGVTALQWVVSAYALTFAGAMLGFGMVGDEFGRKRVMLAGIGIFCAGSVLSALAPSVGDADCRAGGDGPGCRGERAWHLVHAAAYIHRRAHPYPCRRRLGRVSGLALAVGPVVGGALVGVWDWRAIFWFNVAFGLAAFAAAVVVLPESSDPDAHRVDIPGTVLAAAALTAFVFAVIGGEDSGFGSRGVLALLGISAAAASAFFWWRAGRPTAP